MSASTGATVLRSYQARIVNAVYQKNGIVVLPTGSGKTFIFAELCRRIVMPPRCSKAVVFVPKQILVEQQAAEIERYLELAGKTSDHELGWTSSKVIVGRFMGETKLPEEFQILVSTPKAFMIAQKKMENSRLHWGNFALVVFDEVQHCLKNDPYRKIALNLPTGLDLKICGFTASLSYAIDEAKMRSSVEQLRQELRIEVFETATTQELQASGYHAHSVQTEMMMMNASIAPEHTITTGSAETGGNLPVPSEQRKPHLMLPVFLKRQCDGQSTDFARELFSVVRSFEEAVAKANPTFVSPIGSKSKLKLAEWASFAHKEKLKALDNELFVLFEGLQSWYDALRLSINSWEEDEELVIVFLQMKKVFSGLCKKHQHPTTRLAVESFADRYEKGRTKFPRCAALLEDLHRHRRELAEQGKQLRGLVFVEQRLVAHVVDHFLKEQGVPSAPLYATGTPASAELTITKAQANDTLAKFRTGEVEVLVTTTVAEEGLDVPEANYVNRFDGVLNAVSFTQGRGRARQEGAVQVVMRERNGRTVADLEAVERAQQDVIVKTKSSNSMGDGDREAQLQKNKEAQKNRERSASEGLRKYFATPSAEKPPISTLNEFVNKTKVVLDETYKKVILSGKPGFECTLTYGSCLRTLKVSGAPASDKKSAKTKAAVTLLSNLASELGDQYGGRIILQTNLNS